MASARAVKSVAPDAHAHAAAPPARTSCGNVILDGALGGGLPAGSLVLLRGESGAGAHEFAFGALGAALESGRSGAWASALRSAGRVARQAADALPAQAAPLLRAIELRPRSLAQDCLDAASSLDARHVLAVESAAALHQGIGDAAFAELLSELAEAAFHADGLILLLHTPGALAPETEARLEESCDAVLTFRWREGSTMRRRILGIDKMHGRAPALASEEVPVFEVGVQQGGGLSLSRVRNLA